MWRTHQIAQPYHAEPTQNRRNQHKIATVETNPTAAQWKFPEKLPARLEAKGTITTARAQQFSKNASTTTVFVSAPGFRESAKLLKRVSKHKNKSHDY